MADAWGGSWSSAWGSSWGSAAVAVAATPLTAGGGRKRRRIFLIEDEEDEAPVEVNRETVRKAIVKAYKRDELGLLRFAVEPDGPKLDLVDLLAELKAREPLYASNLVNLLKKLRDDEDEEDIELLLMS